MKTRDNLLIDATALATYLLAANPAITGIATHEWISLAFVGTALVHLALHADWVARVVRRYFNGASTRSRLLLALDTLTGATVTTVTVSGLAVSTAIAGVLGLSWSAAPVWRTLHATSATAVLLLAIAHVTVHWKWIATACRLHVLAPLRSASARAGASPIAGRAIAFGVPGLVLASAIALAALGLTATASTGYAANTTTGQTLTCPATGCTASTCHATSGQQGGGRRGGFGG